MRCRLLHATSFGCSNATHLEIEIVDKERICGVGLIF